MYEFVCDRIIPGCDFKARAETHEKMKAKAVEHMRESHEMTDLDKDVLERLNQAAIWAVRLR